MTASTGTTISRMKRRPRRRGAGAVAGACVAGAGVSASGLRASGASLRAGLAMGHVQFRFLMCVLLNGAPQVVLGDAEGFDQGADRPGIDALEHGRHEVFAEAVEPLHERTRRRR